jgi:hypothetical protein
MWLFRWVRGTEAVVVSVLAGRRVLMRVGCGYMQAVVWCTMIGVGGVSEIFFSSVLRMLCSYGKGCSCLSDSSAMLVACVRLSR